MGKFRIAIFVTAIVLISITAGMEAHGQGIVGDHWPTMAYNPANQTYVVMYQRYGEIFDVGTALDPWGASRGPAGGYPGPYETWDRQYAKPSIAFGAANNGFLLAWTAPWPYNNLYGQLLNEAGQFVVDAPFPISSGPGVQSDARVTFDSANRRFLVTWADYRTEGHTALYGQLVDAAGALQGAEFVIEADMGDKGDSYSVAYDPGNGRYLAVWVRGAVYGRLLHADGTPIGDKFIIYEYDWCPMGSASVAFDPLNGRYLVAYDLWAGGGFIGGQFVNADGTLHQTPIGIGTTGLNPAAAYDEVNRRFLVAWASGNTYVQFVDTDGTLQGDRINISHKGKLLGYDSRPAIAFNPVCGNFLVAGTTVHDYSRNPWIWQSMLEMKIVGDPCPQAVLTVKKQGKERLKWRILGGSLKCTVNICKGKYIQGSTVTITADIPVSAWTGCDTVIDNVCSVTMDGKKTVSAMHR